MPPLNPRLYAALDRALGVQKVANPGQPMAAVYVPGPDGRPRLTPRTAGRRTFWSARSATTLAGTCTSTTAGPCATRRTAP